MRDIHCLPAPPRRRGRTTARLAASVAAFALIAGAGVRPASAEEPTPAPTSASAAPAPEPSAEPTPEPSAQPTAGPSAETTPEPTAAPTARPVAEETPTPDGNPQQATSSSASIGTRVDPPATDATAPEPDSTLHTSRDVAATASRLVEDCTGAAGVCTQAQRAGEGALALASSCLAATGAGVVTLLDGDPMECERIVAMGVALADFVLEQANACTAAHDPACATVLGAAALALDRAAGCLDGALTETGAGVRLTDGTDAGCGAAVAMLYRTAQGLVSLLSGCLQGTEALCGIVAGYATFAVDGLTGCAGVLALRLAEVPAPLQPNDTLPCWSVVDQVNQALNQVMGELPGVPTQISPTDDCSVTVAAAESADEATRLLVPSCYPPESLGSTTDHSMPAVPQLHPVMGRSCEETRDYRIDKVLTDEKVRLDHDTFTNVNMDPVTVELELSVGAEIEARWTGQAGAEGNVMLAKVKSQVEASVAMKLHAEYRKTLRYTVKKKTTAHIAYLVFRKVVEGHFFYRYDDCRTENLFRRFKGPFEQGKFGWTEPYTGGRPQ